MAPAARLYVVDDDPFCFDMISTLLRGEGYELRYLDDSAAAFDAIREGRPHVVLSDLMMPKVSGLELCRRIKEDPATRDIPVILLTSLDDEAYLTRCLDAGADDFLDKGISAPVLRARIRSMLRIRAHYDLLREAMRLREDFANIVIHDIGNPLSTILIEADDLLASSPRDDQAASLATIRSNAKRLREMTTDMLLLAKIDHGKLHLDLAAHDLCALVAEAVEHARPLARRRKLALRVEHEDGAVLPCSCDRGLVLRVLDNILSNAIKFSPPQGTIAVRLRALEGPGAPRGRRLRIEIEDEGPGIPEALREKVFEKFEIGQVKRDVPQIGLGLAFSRMAVEAHGGTITASTGRNGQGALMTIDL
ncbi:MAG TPA: hybrid sensor histidine kinase/response regulator [Candidatus Methylacidiphilales bacterium]